MSALSYYQTGVKVVTKMPVAVWEALEDSGEFLVVLPKDAYSENQILWP